MTEKISKVEFNNQDRRICIVETDEGNEIMGTEVTREAKACPWRESNAVKFTDEGISDICFAECEHPDQNTKHLSNFCQPLINRINRERSS